MKQLYTGSGSPNGHVSANAGDFYVDMAGNAFYVKREGDEDSDGWVLLSVGGGSTSSGDSLPDSGTEGQTFRLSNPAIYPNGIWVYSGGAWNPPVEPLSDLISGSVFNADGVFDEMHVDLSSLNNMQAVGFPSLYLLGVLTVVIGLTTLVNADEYPSIAFVPASSVETLEFPTLASIQAPGFQIFGSSAAALTSIQLPVLATADGNGDGATIAIVDCAVLPSLTFPVLTRLTGSEVEINGCPELALLSFPALTDLGDGMQILLSDNAFTQDCVNALLALFVATGATGCTLDMSGGTSASPSGQGITDVATLEDAGWTVVTN
jgi:hypothetical protein